MKLGRRAGVLLGCLLAAPAGMAQAAELRLAVTTSFQNSGLSDVLLPEILADTGVEVHLIVVGTGQALELGRRGDVDAVLVHSPAAEDAFVAAGHGLGRVEIMYNDFILVGPAHDPAGVGARAEVAAAFTAVAGAEVLFISRGDDSGTHNRELSIWEAAGLDPAGFGDWYREAGSGMQASLNIANDLGGYILTDRGTWLNFAGDAVLEVVFEGDPALFNQYAFIPVSAERHDHVNVDAARAVAGWLTGAEGQAMIARFTIDGREPFVPNATADGVTR